MKLNQVNKKTTPADFAEALHDDTGYQFISGKYFLPASGEGRFNVITREEFIRRIWNVKCNGSRVLRDATAAQNVVKTFESIYNGVDGYDWYVPTLWLDALDWDESKYVDLPFELPIKTYALINAMTTENGAERFFIMYGRGGTGKSTTLNIVKQLFDNDVCAMTLDRLTDRFTAANASEARLVCSDEVNTINLDSGRLKLIVSEQMDTVERKCQNPYQIKWQSKLLFSCNKLPYFDVSDSGMMRRIVFYKMDTVIKNPNIQLNNLTFTREQLLTILHKAWSLDMTNWFEKYFMQETFEAVFMKHSVYLHRDAYDYLDYVSRCRNSGLKPVSEPNWQNILETIKTWEEKLK